MPDTIDQTAPEWATRLLKVPEAARILGEHPSTYHRKAKAGVYPEIIHNGTSARIRGWELWHMFKTPESA